MSALPWYCEKGMCWEKLLITHRNSSQNSISGLASFVAGHHGHQDTPKLHNPPAPSPADGFLWDSSASGKRGKLLKKLRRKSGWKVWLFVFSVERQSRSSYAWVFSFLLLQALFLLNTLFTYTNNSRRNVLEETPLPQFSGTQSRGWVDWRCLWAIYWRITSSC